MAARITIELVRATKASIKAELGSFQGKDRLKEALRRFDAKLSAASSEDNLAAIVYGMSALFYHQSQGGLTAKQVQTIAESIQSILRLLAVPSKSSNLSFLHEELYSVLSLIARRTGDNWAGAWQLLLAVRSSPRKDYFRHSLGLALRALRMGLGPVAMREFTTATQQAVTDHDRFFARLGHAKALRLAGRRDHAKAAIASLNSQREGIGAEMLQELAWEERCLEAIAKDDTKVLVALVKPRRSHHEAAYLLEAKLWTYCDNSARSIDRLPKADSIRRDSKLNLATHKPLLQIVTQIEGLYDATYPVEHRLAELGKALGSLDTLLGVDHQLLALASAARWLYRRQLFGFLEFVLAHYTNLSRSLSGGDCLDALGMLQDLPLSQNNDYRLVS